MFLKASGARTMDEKDEMGRNSHNWLSNVFSVFTVDVYVLRFSSSLRKSPVIVCSKFKSEGSDMADFIILIETIMRLCRFGCDGCFKLFL